MPARKTIIPADYQIDLDRIPSQPDKGFAAILIMVCVFLVASGGGLLFYSRTAALKTPIPTPTPDESGIIAIRMMVESRRLTLTALPTIPTSSPSPTIDYCFWLTPTETPAPVSTVDEWGKTGTAVYLATNPYQSPTPTPDVPRMWCNNIPTMTATLTPLKLLSDTPTSTPSSTPTLTPTMAAVNAVNYNSNGYNSGSNGVYLAPTFLPPAPSDVIPIPPTLTITQTQTSTLVGTPLSILRRREG